MYLLLGLGFVGFALFGCSGRGHETRDTAHDPTETTHPALDERSGRVVLINAVIQDVLTNSQLMGICNDYGLQNKRTVGLNTESTVPWPEGYLPHVAGFQFEYLDPKRFSEYESNGPQLGIAIEHFAWPLVFDSQEKRNTFDLDGGFSIVIRLYNISGDPGGIAPNNPSYLGYGIYSTDKGLVIQFEQFLDN